MTCISVFLRLWHSKRFELIGYNNRMRQQWRTCIRTAETDSHYWILLSHFPYHVDCLQLCNVLEKACVIMKYKS